MDNRFICKYGAKCYQKNPHHLNKYKHIGRDQEEELEPTTKRLKVDKESQGIRDELSSSEDEIIAEPKKISSPRREKPEKNVPIAVKDTKVIEKRLKVGKESQGLRDELSSSEDKIIAEPKKISSPRREKHEENVPIAIKDTKVIEKPMEQEDIHLNPKEFIQKKFLVEMPDDFYKFWDFCKTIKPSDPCKAFLDCGLLLVGPFDVLAGRFSNTLHEDEEFLLHWRYFYDIPEFQTVLKGDDKTGQHIGYFRDDPKENPVFLAANSANENGNLRVFGGNIFAAVCGHIDETMKSCDPFTKMKLLKLKENLKKKALTLNYSLSLKCGAKREIKVVKRTFNKFGFVVPYNKKSQLGYRELAMDDRELKQLLTKIKECDEEFLDSVLDKLDPVITYANIALDECDFGTGLELGWNLWYYGIDQLNGTVSRVLKNTYELLNRPQFSRIIEAHALNRKRGCDLSIVRDSC